MWKYHVGCYICYRCIETHYGPFIPIFTPHILSSGQLGLSTRTNLLRLPIPAILRLRHVTEFFLNGQATLIMQHPSLQLARTVITCRKPLPEYQCVSRLALCCQHRMFWCKTISLQRMQLEVSHIDLHFSWTCVGEQLALINEVLFVYSSFWCVSLDKW